MADTASLEPQEAQPAPESTSRKDGKTYKTVKTIVTFSLLGVIILNILISLLFYIGVTNGRIVGTSYVYEVTNVFKFAFGENGLIDSLISVFDRMANGSSNAAMNAMSSMYRIYGLLAGAIAVIVISVITLIKTIIHAAKKDTEKLTVDLIGVVGMNLTGIMLIKLFSHETDYGSNYAIGGGLIASLVISLAALLAIAVLNFIFFREDIHKANKYKDILRSLSTCVCHLIAFAVLAAAAYYYCFYYLFGNLEYMGRADADELVAMLFNFVVFVLTIVVLARLSKAITKSLSYVCTLSDTPSSYAKNASSGFIGTFVMTLLSFIALLIAARDYAAVSFVYPLGACLVAIVGEVCYILFNKADFFKENTAEAVPAEAPAAESSTPVAENTAPVAESSAPATETAPVAETAEPAKEETAPAKEDDTPSDNGATK